MSTQASMSASPSFQSACASSESSVRSGGTDTWPLVPVVVAPSINEPPRKQTRWSCFGDTRHALRAYYVSVYRNSVTNEGIHLSVLLAFWEKLAGVRMSLDHAFPNEPCVDSLHCLCIHLGESKLSGAR